jgi:hypothetical protein
MVVTTSPIKTGTRFLLASSNASTLQMAAAGINAHGTRVLLPTKDIYYFADKIIISRGIPVPLL